MSWDLAYEEEYHGLQDMHTWEVITEKQYQDLRPLIGRALPTMAIATLKRDADGKPVRCKYRIVVLGNMDPHFWEKQDCFAPVLSQLELRTLVTFATRLRRVPKQGDVSQAFVNTLLPSQEKYVIRPPAGCPLSGLGTFLQLRKTLYGLKRSPRHWFNTCRDAFIKLGLQPCPNAPCVFTGKVLPDSPTLYVDLYVDDFIYFSTSDKVETHFETEFAKLFKVDYMGSVNHFLGIAFTHQWTHNQTELSIYMNQSACIEALLADNNLTSPHMRETATPYRNGLPIDKIKPQTYSPQHQQHLTTNFQRIIGSLQWLAQCTRPDIATVTNILSQYNHDPTEGHLNHCKHVLRYLKGSSHLGIGFTSCCDSELTSFLKFPLPPEQITALTDANWGPQDQSTPKNGYTYDDLALFKSRSLSGYVIWLGGPIHWVSKRQAITARSSAEAEIYATDECVKQIIHLQHLVEDLNITNLVMPSTTKVYNDNTACVTWSKSMTTKGLRHIQIRENAVRESVQK